MYEICNPNVNLASFCLTEQKTLFQRDLNDEPVHDSHGALCDVTVDTTPVSVLEVSVCIPGCSLLHVSEQKNIFDPVFNVTV